MSKQNLQKEDRVFDFKKHLSPSLEWKWKFKSFKVIRAEVIDDDSVRITFKIKNRLLFGILSLFYPKGFPVSGFDSSRLAFSASIIAAGHALNKDKKDGHVIVSNMKIDYVSPVWYSVNVEIPVDVDIRIIKKMDDYLVFKSNFSMGDDKGHIGETTLLYCNPGVDLLYNQ